MRCVGVRDVCACVDVCEYMYRYVCVCVHVCVQRDSLVTVLH